MKFVDPYARLDRVRQPNQGGAEGIVNLKCKLETRDEHRISFAIRATAIDWFPARPRHHPAPQRSSDSSPPGAARVRQCGCGARRRPGGDRPEWGLVTAPGP